MSKFAKILLIAQITDGQTATYEYDGVDTIYVPSPYDTIEKSRLINIGASRVKTPYFWMNDADIVVPFQEAIGQVNHRSPFYLPYRFFIYLDEEETTEYISKGTVRTKRTETNMQAFAGGFIANKDEFMKLGGMDEKYVGWGYEDTELAERVQRFSRYEILDALIGAHLYHNPSHGDMEGRAEANRGTFIRNRPLLKMNVERYFGKIKSPFINRKFLSSHELLQKIKSGQVSKA
ncbi:MAG: hypothetical protein HC888_00100 [Candidatus Competibacteraceae bacterium]|nr:hypothetical protein [Candidatus Competibacteraceae bacterium]